MYPEPAITVQVYRTGYHSAVQMYVQNLLSQCSPDVCTELVITVTVTGYHSPGHHRPHVPLQPGQQLRLLPAVIAPGDVQGDQRGQRGGVSPGVLEHVNKV